jgi:hypothetical protein
MNSLGLIFCLNYLSMNKCEICVEAKITKKYVHLLKEKLNYLA